MTSASAMRLSATLLSLAALSISVPAPAQNCGWSRIDHRVKYDASGPWNPSVYRDLVGALTIAEVGGALWEGADSRFGRTLWQGMDSQIIAEIGATAGKAIFKRVRPSETDNPCLWFKGGSNYSFPSAEASVAAALVAPYILEYGPDYPLTYALLLLPLYIGEGRIKNRQHWQSDVLAGWAIGGVSGWYAHSRDVPVLVQILPNGFSVGLHKQF